MNRSQFASRYTSALADYVRDRDERSLRGAYELGREGVAAGVAVLDVAAAHHDVLIAVVEAASPEESAGVIARAGEFLVETLAAYEMVQRGLPEVQSAVEADRRHARLLRRLSAFLSDESLALADEGAIEELLQLVVEHAVEIADAQSCSIEVTVPATQRSVQAFAVDADVALHEARPADGVSAVRTPLLALDGATMGWIEVSTSAATPLAEAAEAVVTQVAQMTAAALDRAFAYRQ
jgi:Phosphoserine phosphatase RsbU, N-terminal domain